jgi:hypothetical protein
MVAPAPAPAPAVDAAKCDGMANAAASKRACNGQQRTRPLHKSIGI